MRRQLLLVTADAERIGLHPGCLVLRRCLPAWPVAVKTILELQGCMHLCHLWVLAVADITR